VIFVTVGGQLPFNRLIRTVDAWAGEHDTAVFAQIGADESPPSNVQWERFVNRVEFRQLMERADLIIAHAGMGTILAALELRKPIVVMPRRAHLGEHRNDHQWGTVQRLPETLGVRVVLDEQELHDHLGASADIPPPTTEISPDYRMLIEHVREFVAR
jgi:UDP-N-acetylglucosamine transferase subunit ALG13